MKTRFRYSYRDSASKLHRTVGDIIRNCSLQYQGVYQEYPVKRISPGYQYSSHHFDWVLLNLKVVIECHGKQHYEPAAFGGDVEASVNNYRNQRRRDNMKKEAALDAGFAYIEIPYTLQNKLSEELLLSMIRDAQIAVEDYITPPAPEPTAFELELEQRHQERLRRARQYNKERYKKIRDARIKHAR